LAACLPGFYRFLLPAFALFTLIGRVGPEMVEGAALS
jgi:hypothetical protein